MASAVAASIAVRRRLAMSLMCAVSPRTGPGLRAPAEAPPRADTGVRGGTEAPEWWSVRPVGRGRDGVRPLKTGRAVPSGAVRETPDALGDPSLARVWLRCVDSTVCHGSAPTTTTCIETQVDVSISFRVFHKAVTGVTVAASPMGALPSTEMQQVKVEPWSPDHGVQPERLTTGQPGHRRQPSPTITEGGGTRATRVARLPRDTHDRTPIRACVCATQVGTGVALPRPHTKPPYSTGKEADGSGVRAARPASIAICPSAVGPTVPRRRPSHSHFPIPAAHARPSRLAVRPRGGRAVARPRWERSRPSGWPAP